MVFGDKLREIGARFDIVGYSDSMAEGDIGGRYRSLCRSFMSGIDIAIYVEDLCRRYTSEIYIGGRYRDIS
jgi:hypothetical protein